MAHITEALPGSSFTSTNDSVSQSWQVVTEGLWLTRPFLRTKLKTRMAQQRSSAKKIIVERRYAHLLSNKAGLTKLDSTICQCKLKGRSYSWERRSNDEGFEVGPSFYELSAILTNSVRQNKRAIPVHGARGGNIVLPEMTMNKDFTLTRSSTANCLAIALRKESLLFPSTKHLPPSPTTQIFASRTGICGPY